MKKYIVTVNGTKYEICLEVADSEDIKSEPDKKVTAAPTNTTGDADGKTVTSPMPGTILSVNVQNGAAVKKGDVLMVLEAMKMENEIIAPCDGTVTSINVQNGSTVETGAILCVIA